MYKFFRLVVAVIALPLMLPATDIFYSITMPSDSASDATFQYVIIGYTKSSSVSDAFDSDGLYVGYSDAEKVSPKVLDSSVRHYEDKFTLVDAIETYSDSNFFVELYNADSDMVAYSNLYSASDLADFIAGSDSQHRYVWTPTMNVPEPTSGVLCLLGAALLALRRKRQPQACA